MTTAVAEEIAKGSLPLADARNEGFAVAVASGARKTAAYRENFGDLAAEGEIVGVSLRSRATRLSQREEVAQRVHYLRGERSKQFDTAPERLTEREVAALMDEAVASLRTCLIAAENARASSADLGHIRREIVTVAGYSERLSVDRADRPDISAGVTGTFLKEALERLHLCTCGDRP